MTIRFVTAWNGYHADQIVSGLGSTEENRLIGLGYAVADLDGPGNTPLPVFATKDLTGGNTISFSDGESLAVDEIVKKRITDFVTISATGFVASNAGTLFSINVLSGNALTLVIKDSAGVTGGRALQTFSGLQAGDFIPLDGAIFTAGLHATLTGGAGSIKFEVQQ